MSHELLTQGAVVAAWGSATLRGVVSPDRALDVISAAGYDLTFQNHDAPADRANSFALAVGSWRSREVEGWRCVPVVPGDSGGLPGPRELRASALDAGVALVSISGSAVALVPCVDAVPPGARPTLTFAEIPADSHGIVPPESVGELDRDLLAALNQVTDDLDDLDVARWHEEVTELRHTWERAPTMPPGTPDRARRLAARSGSVLAMVELASTDHGGSRSASDMSLRSGALRRLALAARTAYAAAWNAAVMSQERRR